MDNNQTSSFAPVPAAEIFQQEPSPRSLEYAQILAKLIQYQTVSDRDLNNFQDFEGFQALLKELFPHFFAACELELFEGSMLLRWPGKDSSLKPAAFMHHQDVVEPNGAWKHEPYSATIEAGLMYGRGVLDDKGGLMCLLQAADDLANQGFVPSRDLYFISSCNEETTGMGADAISAELARRGISFDFCLDEGGLIVRNPFDGVEGNYALIGVGEKCDLTLKFVARSEGGHASTPPKDTPLVRLGAFMVEMDKSNIFTKKLPDATAQMLQAFGTGTTGFVGHVYRHAHLYRHLLPAIMTKLSPVTKSMISTTIAFTIAQGSKGYNVIPSEACVYGNMRCSHHQGVASSIAAVEAIAKKHNIEVEIFDSPQESSLTDYRGEAFMMVSQAVDASFEGVTVAPYIMPGASDSRFMSRVCDNCLRFTPFVSSLQQVEAIHGLDESLYFANLEPAVRFYQHLMKEL